MSRRLVIAVVGLVLAVSGLVLVTVGSGRASTATRALDGRSLFVAKGCASCHSGPDSSPTIGGGPPLVAVAEWAGERRPGLDAAGYVAESIRAPGAFLSPAREGDTEMPALTLTADEIDLLVDYLLER